MQQDTTAQVIRQTRVTEKNRSEEKSFSNKPVQYLQANARLQKIKYINGWTNVGKDF